MVLAIIAVMLTMALPKYFGQLDASKEAILRENLRLSREVLDHFYGDRGRYPESLQELVDRGYLRGLPHDPMTDSSDRWVLVPPPAEYKGSVYDLHSASDGIGKNGKAYAEW